MGSSLLHLSLPSSPIRAGTVLQKTLGTAPAGETTSPSATSPSPLHGNPAGHSHGIVAVSPSKQASRERHVDGHDHQSLRGGKVSHTSLTPDSHLEGTRLSHQRAQDGQCRRRDKAAIRCVALMLYRLLFPSGSGPDLANGFVFLARRMMTPFWGVLSSIDATAGVRLHPSPSAPAPYQTQILI